MTETKRKRCFSWVGSQANYFVNNLDALPKDGGQIICCEYGLNWSQRGSQEKQKGTKSHLRMPVLLQKVNHNLLTLLHRTPALPSLMMLEHKAISGSVSAAEWQNALKGSGLLLWQECLRRRSIPLSVVCCFTHSSKKSILGGHLCGMR